VRVQRVVLKDHRDVPVLRRQVVDETVADVDTPRRDGLEPGDHPERGSLAAPRRAHEHDQLAVGDVEVDAMNGDIAAVLIYLSHAFEADPGHG
jgi:hypothetical protein